MQAEIAVWLIGALMLAAIALRNDDPAVDAALVIAVVLLLALTLLVGLIFF